MCSLAVLGCTRKASADGNVPSTEEKLKNFVPTITTYLFAERGADTLVLLESIQAEGYLKEDLHTRETVVPANHYRFSFLSASSDTLAQAIRPSTITERLESPQPDGSINSVEVTHAEGILTVRTSKYASTVAILVERGVAKEKPNYLQTISLRGEN